MWWSVGFMGTEAQLDEREIGTIFEPPGDEPEEALRRYLEGTRLPNGRYRLRTEDGEPLGEEIDFVREKPLPPIKSLRRVR